jgi:hypothetical protein
MQKWKFLVEPFSHDKKKWSNLLGLLNWSFFRFKDDPSTSGNNSAFELSPQFYECAHFSCHYPYPPSAGGVDQVSSIVLGFEIKHAFKVLEKSLFVSCFLLNLCKLDFCHA